MVRGDIVGGIKVALSKGQNLQDIMQSFYNSGYKKEDIEEAARIIKNEGFHPIINQYSEEKKTPNPQISKKETHPEYTPPPAKPSLTPVLKIEKKEELKPPVAPVLLEIPKAPVQNNIPNNNNNNNQKTISEIYIPKARVVEQTVSAYGKEDKKGVDFVTILLIIILAILIGVLVGVFFFKDNIVEFLNKILE